MQRPRWLLIVIALTVLVVGARIYDASRVDNVHFRVLVDPHEVVADGSAVAEIEVHVTDTAGKPVAGHDIFGFASPGRLNTNRQRTDARGVVTFVYFSYLLDAGQVPRDAQVELRDESNSVFIEIDPVYRFTIPMVAPESGHEDGQTSDAFFTD